MLDNTFNPATKAKQAATNLLLSCFSGAGGMDLGLEAAGFTNRGCIELDATAQGTIAKNREGRWPLLEVADVLEAGRTLQPQDLGVEKGELTLLAGGPPCQPFSTAAQWNRPKQGISDSRGTAVFGMLDLVERMLPRAVLLENVAGFLQGAASARETINSRLDSINSANNTNYRLYSWLLNSADFGVAQNRRRTIAVAFRDLPEHVELCPPNGAFRKSPLTAWDALCDVNPSVVPVCEGKYADLLPSIPEGENYQYLTARGGGSGVELFGYRTRYWNFLLKLSRSRPAWTLSAHPGPSTGPFHWNNRPLAIEERLAIQGLPTNWRLAGSTRDQIKLVGNATPPPLAEAMGLFIRAVISGDLAPPSTSIQPTLARLRRGNPPPPEKPRRLPKHWKAKVGPKAPHPGAGQGPGGHTPHKIRSRDHYISN